MDCRYQREDKTLLYVVLLQCFFCSREGRSPPGVWIQQNMVAQISITAGANSFLCIYYGKVNAFLPPKEDAEAGADESDS